MKRISIFLVKVHRFYYLLLGALIALIVFSKVENVQQMIPTADVNPPSSRFLLYLELAIYNLLLWHFSTLRKSVQLMKSTEIYIPLVDMFFGINILLAK